MSESELPRRAYLLGHHDKRFLKALRIAQDDVTTPTLEQVPAQSSTDEASDAGAR